MEETSDPINSENQANFKKFKRKLNEKNENSFYVDGKEVNKEEFLREQDSFRLSPIQILRQDSKSF
jgi:hypothetical protein